MSDVLTLHRSLYAPDAVRAAAEAYAAVAKVSVVERDHELVVSFDEVDPDVADELADAFANHALFETVQRRRSSA